MEQMMEKGGMVCKCGHHSVWGWLVALFGVVFLAEGLGWLDSATVAVVWPIIVIAAGLTAVFGKNCKCC